MAEEREKKERVNPYRLNLVPGEEQRRSQWNLILISDIPVTVDFYHTDMLEKVIAIQGTSTTSKSKEEVIENDTTREEGRGEDETKKGFEAKGEKASTRRESARTGSDTD